VEDFATIVAEDFTTIAAEDFTTTVAEDFALIAPRRWDVVDEQVGAKD
jgi:hypothetical protein